jgi:thymidylate synthase
MEKDLANRPQESMWQAFNRIEEELEKEITEWERANLVQNNADKRYFELVNKILAEGEWKGNRTGVDCLAIAGFMFEHDMSEGFPLLTSRKLPFKSTTVELEFFIKGLRSKKWLQDRGCHYWDGWCNPQKVAYAHDEETKRRMAEEDDLGLIYGTQWRDFRDPSMPDGSGIDQLKEAVNKLKTNPLDRRMLVSAWNPLAIPHAALPSCHDGFRISVVNNKLNLAWTQRSVDVCCNQSITTYGLLLHLLAKEANLQEGKLIGFLMDCHIYKNHLDGIQKQLSQKTHNLPRVQTKNFSSIFDWTYSDTSLLDYQHSEPIRYEVAI